MCMGVDLCSSLGGIFKIIVQNRAILCKIWQYLCRKLAAKVVLINDILLADKADSQLKKAVQM